MLFGVVSMVQLGMGVLDFGGDRRREGAVLGGEFEASHCKQWGLCDALLSNYFEKLITYVDGQGALSDAEIRLSVRPSVNLSVCLLHACIAQQRCILELRLLQNAHRKSHAVNRTLYNGWRHFRSIRQVAAHRYAHVELPSAGRYRFAARTLFYASMHRLLARCDDTKDVCFRALIRLE